MAKMIQIRNVPDDVHRTLKARAAEAGMSLSEYLLRDLTHLANIPSEEELFRRIRERQERGEGASPGSATKAVVEGRAE